jgi:hypothetical protein
MNEEELKKELKTLKALREECIKKREEILDAYRRMEGMYGKKVKINDARADHCFGGYAYIYEYPSVEIQIKEEEERKQFLIDNGMEGVTLTSWGIEYTPYDEKIEEVENKIYILKHGESKEVTRLRKSIKYREDKLEELKTVRIPNLEEEIKQLKEKYKRLTK